MPSRSSLTVATARRGVLAIGALLIGSASTVAAQSFIVDTLRTSCWSVSAAARTCATARLAHRVQARLGLADVLTWDGSRSAFVAGDLTIPARVRYVETGHNVVAVATFDAPRAAPLPTGLASAASESPAHRTDASVPVRLDASAAAAASAPIDADAGLSALAPVRSAEAALSSRRVTSLIALTPGQPTANADLLASTRYALAHFAPPAVGAPRLPSVPPPMLIVRGPGPQVPVIIGREKPIALRFTLADSTLLVPGVNAPASTDLTVRTAIQPVPMSNGTCKTGWFSPLDVADARLESDGTLTCYVRYGESVTPDRVTKMSVEIDAGHRHLTRTISVIPVVAPTYAVRGGDGCEAVAARVHKMLVDRGVPVVSFGIAHRRADLTHCERFDRILPVAVGSLNPAGIYLTGGVSESGVSVFADARDVGPIELWTTKPNGDPTNELAEAIVARLLKYTGL